jgi:hypothetical protein
MTELKNTMTTSTAKKRVGRPALPKKEKKIARKESLKKYRESKAEFKCRIDNSLLEQIKELRESLSLTSEQLLKYFVEKEKNSQMQDIETINQQ